jgi:hypothetical protein
MNLKLYILVAIFCFCRAYSAAPCNDIFYVEKQVVAKLDSFRKDVTGESDKAALEQLKNKVFEFGETHDAKRAKAFNPKVKTLFDEVNNMINRRLHPDLERSRFVPVSIDF